MAEPLPIRNEKLTDTSAEKGIAVVDEKGALAIARQGSEESDHETVVGTPGELETNQSPLEKAPVKTLEHFESTRLRHHWWQVWRPTTPAPQPPATFDDSPMLQLAYCNWFALMTFSWCFDIMKIGYQRPLQPTDLRKIDPSREAAGLTKNLDDEWNRQVAAADNYNARLLSGDIPIPKKQRMKWIFKSKVERARLEQEWRTNVGRRHPSLAWAMIYQFRVFYGLACVFKIVGDSCQMLSPILARAIIAYTQEKERAREAGTALPGVGRGVGMSIGLYLLTVCWSLNTQQVWWRGMSTGMLLRGALTGSVFKRAFVLTNEARAIYPNGKLINYISTDISRIEYCAIWAHSIPSSIPQILLCTGLLIGQIGPSALAGIAFFALVVPLQVFTMKWLLKVRTGSMGFTDSRSKLLQELLGSFRVLKYFTFEKAYAERIDQLRRNEMKGIRSLSMIRAMNQAFAFSVPTLSAVVAFITYIGAGHSLEPTKIFTALALFQLLRQPLMLLPTALSALVDAYQATRRLTEFYHAKTMDTKLNVDEDQKLAVSVRNATFEWLTSAPPDTKKLSKKERKRQLKAGSGTETPEAQAEPFKVKNLNMSIERGSLVAIVGAVGSGKSSILQGLIGEMKRSSGDVSFCGNVAYCPQAAWIQNATVRDNITFGRDFDEQRYWDAVERSSLLPDFAMLGDADLTEIGERGINLSGGQKQRVSICRALYSHEADVVVLDDPLSALDAHVGKSVFHNAIVELRDRGKTVILVTHALHLLHEVDYIYTLVEGDVVEQGRYETLIENDGAFAQLMREFGGSEEEEHEEQDAQEEEAVEGGDEKQIEDAREKIILKVREKVARIEGTGKEEGKLMIKEKRDTGAIKKNVYSEYVKAGNGRILMPMILLLCVLMQTAQVMASYWIVWWQKDHFHKPSGWWMGIFAALGLSQALMTLSLGFTLAFFNYFASRNLHLQAVHRIFYAPMSFFDQTPLGRIMGVFGRDFDVMDNTLPESLRNVIMTVANVLGSIILITVFEHYFIIVAVAVTCGYRVLQRFYQFTGREAKRLDSLLRGSLYAHFSESLNGMSTIRAFAETPRFLGENSRRTDLEARAYIVYLGTQRWLAIRLDFCGAFLVLAVALFVSIGSSGVSAAQVGLLLTYTVSLVQMFGMLTRQSAEIESNFNSAERIVWYCNGGVPQEAAYEIEVNRPAKGWPASGAIQISNAVMSYRPNLPPVLKGITLSINGGERVGVVGRTGAGKSSIMSALFRLVELTSGSIEIDGVDIAKIGLKDLRSAMVIIPQDPLLFSGTIRTNLDPFGLYDDARLWSALRRAHLVGTDTEKVVAEADERFSLDMKVEEEGNNLSVGQRSLVSLARALVREEAKIVILDEATAAVDLETDAKIQQTIRTELKHQTLLTIAHRLRTIIFYDKILVMDQGQVAEFDTPLNLFRHESSIFRQMCDQSAITEEEIVKSDH